MDAAADDARLDELTDGRGTVLDLNLQVDESEFTALAVDLALTASAALPARLRTSIIAEGEALASARFGSTRSDQTPHVSPVHDTSTNGSSGGGVLRYALAASLLLAVGGAAFLGVLAAQRDAALERERELVASLTAQVEENQTLLASSRDRLDQIRQSLEETEGVAAERQRRLLALAERNQSLAEQLANATSDVDRLELRIADLTEPRDPAELEQNRQKLLELPGTVRVAWQPFNLEGAPPPEQTNVTGDVVWNDELETGYITFSGLDPNDPNIEQYQVWVIDERGLEQKVSGGVFNANDRGEIIVQIDPHIDVGRVALFAVTVENPGGTAVPDLQRRVVVAPREEG